MIIKHPEDSGRFIAKTVMPYILKQLISWIK